jgi:hypothetical protein
LFLLPGCHVCHAQHAECNQERPFSASDLKAFSASSVRARLMTLKRWVGPTVGGVSFNAHGEIWVSVAQNRYVGIDKNGGRLHVDYASGQGPGEDPSWDPTAPRLRLRDVDAPVIGRVIAILHRRQPHQIFQGAKVARTSDSGVVWQFDTLADSTKYGGPETWYAHGNGSGLCRDFHGCPDSLSMAL